MLSEVKFNPYYNTYENDVVNDFYNKALSQACMYKRVSAYFSSKSLSYYSKGISNLIVNNGKMQFVISKDISKETYETIVKGYEGRKLLEEELIYSLEEELSKQEEQRIANLAYLIEHGYVDIKIALVKHGIFHDKYGIIEDNNNNILYFRHSFLVLSKLTCQYYIFVNLNSQ